MSFKEIIDVPQNHQIVINLPRSFPSKKKVIVTVEEVTLTKEEKFKLMEKAVKDPRFLKDMEEVNKDFESISN